MKSAIAVVVILAAVLMLALPVSRAITPQQSRSLTVEQRKNAPVIVTSLKLGDTSITPNARFRTSATWTDDLKITVSNDSEQPISYIEVNVAIDDYAQRRTVMSADYIFGKQEGGTERLTPGDSVVLTKTNMTMGDPTTPGLIRVTPRRVRWNGDASREWYGGFEMYRDPDNPKVYKREPASQVRYQFPAGYKQGPTLVKARASSLVTENCDRAATNSSTFYCRVCSNINQPVKYCTTTEINSTTCDGNCDILDWTSYEVCGSTECSFAECYGAGANVKSLGPVCNYPGTPILIDVQGNGLQLTDKQGGVVFSFNGAASVQTSWTAVGSDDSFLCKDRNGNGLCDDGTELFGNYSPQAPSFSPNGFRTLALEDTNGDGKVSGTELADLLLWNDANHNGVSESGEMFSLPSVKLTSLDTRYTSSRRKDRFDNWLRYRANGKMDGRTIQVHDVFFVT